MPNLMQRGAAFLGEKLKSAAGRSVTLTQGATTLAITSWHARHEYEVVDEQGLPEKVASYDWSIVEEDLDGLVLRPGATITDGSAVYEAMAIGTRQCVERLDSSGVLLTLHTRQIT